jgi:hypothetical protein
MSRLFFTWIACGLALPIPAHAQARTFFEERLLDQAPVIVRARYDGDQSCFDVDVAAFRVARRLHGEADSRVLVLGAGQLSKRFKDTDRLLFLKPEPSGCLHRIVDVIDLVSEADATEAFVRGFVALAKESEPSKRRSGLKQLVRDGLAMRTEFPRRLAICEVERLARRSPPQYSIEELSELARIARGFPPDEAGRLGAAVEAAENGLLREFAGTQSAFTGSRRQTYVRAVADYLQDSEVERRTTAIERVATTFGEDAVPFLLKTLDDDAVAGHAARHLGGMKAKSAVPKLIDRLKAGGASTGPVIDALGEVGDESAVSAISRHLSSAEHFESAALALARIGGPAASRTLDGVLAQLRRDPRQQPRVELLQRVRSKTFRDEDEQRRAEAKARYGRE